MVAIKDLKMPRSCFSCPFGKKGSLIDGGYFCRLQPISENVVVFAKSQYRINGEFKDKQGCPLIEIETLTDKEKRIFLSAMGREEVVCKQIDVDKVDDGSTLKLVPICKSIEKKVKKVLWR